MPNTSCGSAPDLFFETFSRHRRQRSSWFLPVPTSTIRVISCQHLKHGESHSTRPRYATKARKTESARVTQPSKNAETLDPRAHFRQFHSSHKSELPAHKYNNFRLGCIFLPFIFLPFIILPGRNAAGRKIAGRKMGLGRCPLRPRRCIGQTVHQLGVDTIQRAQLRLTATPERAV